MRYVIQVCYDGEDYGGWQIQPNVTTVQQVLQEGLSVAFKQPITVTASGRTDAGVHAFGQICHFDAEITAPADKIGECANRYLPDDVKILKSNRAADGFDSNRSAKKKTYAYHLYLSNINVPLKDRYATQVKGKIDVEKMKQAAKCIEGTHDFAAFCASGSTVKTTVRTVYSVEISEGYSYGCTDLVIRVTGNGFLYNMVRTIAGTLVAIGSSLRSVEQLKAALLFKDRDLLGKTMPAKGLVLEEVDYGYPLF